jgi:endonuclease/exonuclease/phosphatase family metal-dependent hydrolase
MIFNIYNPCNHSGTETALWQFLQNNTNDTWRGNDHHMIWCGDFNRHHPLWDRDEDTHLFTSGALNAADHLIRLLADHGMEMVLPKGVPTLQHLRSK